MTESFVQYDLAENEFAAAVQENLFALFRVMAEALPGSEIVETDKISYHLTTPTNPMFKGVWRSHLSGDEADTIIAETIAWFKARQAPFFFWWTGPDSAPDNLADRLLAHGLIDLAEDTSLPELQGAPCMVADLDQLDEGLLHQTPPGFTIEEVRDEVALQAFKQVLIEGYDIPELMADGWVQASTQVGIGQTPWKLYLGRLDGTPVASSIILNGAGVSGLYGIATTPAARRQGIGAAITVKPLLDARANGFRYGVLWSTQMGMPLYQRLGFRLTNGRINRYLWRRG